MADEPTPTPGSLDDFDDATIEHMTNLNRIDQELLRLIGDADATPSMEDMHRALRLLFERQLAQDRWQNHCHQEAAHWLAGQVQHNTQVHQQLLNLLGPKNS